jgi:hypothetical protein
MKLRLLALGAMAAAAKLVSTVNAQYNQTSELAYDDENQSSQTLVIIEDTNPAVVLEAILNAPEDAYIYPTLKADLLIQNCGEELYGPSKNYVLVPHNVTALEAFAALYNGAGGVGGSVIDMMFNGKALNPNDKAKAQELFKKESKYSNEKRVECTKEEKEAYGNRFPGCEKTVTLKYFDYVNGRAMKTWIAQNDQDLERYDRKIYVSGYDAQIYNGPGAAGRALCNAPKFSEDQPETKSKNRNTI